MLRFTEQVNKILTEGKVIRYKNLFKTYNSAYPSCFKYYKDPECMTLHREDGPAVDYPGLEDKNKYYLEGKQVSKIEHAVLTSNVPKDKIKKVIDLTNI